MAAATHAVRGCLSLYSCDHTLILFMYVKLRSSRTRRRPRHLDEFVAQPPRVQRERGVTYDDRVYACQVRMYHCKEAQSLF